MIIVVAKIKARMFRKHDYFAILKYINTFKYHASALMRRYLLELFIFIAYFSTFVPFNVVFYPVGISSLMRHFQQVL